nr:MAG TPA: hypothetical protein [Bacteriophage sp.]
MAEISEAAREAQRAYNRAWYAKNRERRLQYQKQWAQEHKAEISARRRPKNAEYEARKWERKAARMAAAQAEAE